MTAPSHPSTRTAPPPIAPRPTHGPLPPAALRARTRRRQAILFALACLALLAVTARLMYWQIGLRQALSGRAAAEALTQILVPAGRGTIRDANGVILALSVTEDSVIADPDVIRQAGARDRMSAALAPLVGLTADQVRAQIDIPGAYAQLRDAAGQPLLLDPAHSRDFATAADAAAKEHNPFVGVALYPVVHRVYPSGSLGSQVLGFVRQSDGSGQYGVESAYDTLLGGQPGVLTTAVDAQGDPLATGPQRWTPPVPGADVTLTLDGTVQDMAERGLADAIARTGADGGSVVILDPRTGAILALANQPAFDPNSYATASLSRFGDPAVGAVFDPGSVMKAMTMAAGIDTGAITPDTTFDDRGVVTVDGVPLHNWGAYAYGTETMTQVLQHSANVGAVFVAQRLGVERFQAYMAAFGYGARTGVDLPAETTGLFPRPADPGEAELAAAEQSFGESIGVTPLQLAAAYGALANGGVLMRPYIVQGVTPDGGRGAATRIQPHVERQVVSAATAWTVTRMLVDSALTSEAQMDLIQGYSIAAKTGTSTPDPHDPSVTYATVAGYAPATNPRFVIVVKLDHPRTSIFGGAAAGPLWRALAQQLFVYYRIPPDIPAGTT
jgi:cell division protein FtsI/penicillin-binding protein 2